MPRVSAVIRHILHLVLPVTCESCGVALTDDPVPFFCRTCWGRIQPLQGPMCPRCGRPFPSSVTLEHSPHHLCWACRQRRPAYTHAWSLYPYVPPLQDAIRLFKYHGKVALTAALGDLMCAAVRQPWEVDLLVPVPLHPSRLREREYNQAILLADRLNRRLHLPLSYDNLIRVRRTDPQTELSRAARLKNLRRSFAVRRPAEVKDKRILLLDDVMTTGTTVNECAKALRKAGAADVYVGTLARTL
ncbi:MAG TPA: ComF family protein [Nitrospiraceae bacterium]|jgi:ComF family protein|nr:ComF family protein [Nitrospiraceae bacterium]